MIRWDSMPGSYNLATYASKCTYSRLKDKFGDKLYSSDVSPFDIT